MFAGMVGAWMFGMGAACVLMIAAALAFGRGLPRGSELLFSNDASRTYANLMDVERRLRVRLPLAGSGFQWSPDGAQIAFSDLPDGDLDIFVTDISGAALRPVTANRVSDFAPVWSPDGRQIAYTSSGEGDTTDVFVIDLESSRPRNISRGIGSSSFASWSADGGYLAFVSILNSVRTTYVVNLSDGDLQPLAVRLAQWRPLGWSPGGHHVLFVGFEAVSSNSDVYVLDIASGQAHNLTRTEHVDDSPVWSPDGQQIAYISHQRGTTDLFVIDVQTGEARNLTRSAVEEFSPAWSPDGRWIAFIAGTFSGTDLYMVEVSTGQIARLTHDPVRESAPRWRP